MNDDTISRRAAIEIASSYRHPDNIADKLRKLPSAQPEIIKCKDCKHGMYDVMCKFYWCHGVAHSANWFCADAERRTDE